MKNMLLIAIPGGGLVAIFVESFEAVEGEEAEQLGEMLHNPLTPVTERELREFL